MFYERFLLAAIPFSVIQTVRAYTKLSNKMRFSIVAVLLLVQCTPFVMDTAVYGGKENIISVIGKPESEIKEIFRQDFRYFILVRQ